VANDRKVKLASHLLVNRHISPGHFLQRISMSMHAATLYGLQWRDYQDDSDSEDFTSDSDSDQNSSSDSDPDDPEQAV